jgi:hypothetical protein
MGGFTVYSVAQGAVCFSVYIDIQKWEVAFFFSFHSEMYLFMESVEIDPGTLPVCLDHGAR